MSQIRLKQLNLDELTVKINELIVVAQVSGIDSSFYYPYISGVVSGAQFYFDNYVSGQVTGVINPAIQDFLSGSSGVSYLLGLYTTGLQTGVIDIAVNNFVLGLSGILSGYLATGIGVGYPPEYTKSIGYFPVNISGDTWNRVVFDFYSGYTGSFSDSFSYRLTTTTIPTQISDLMIMEDINFRQSGQFGLNLYYNMNGSGTPVSFDLMVNLKGTGWSGPTESILSGVTP